MPLRLRRQVRSCRNCGDLCAAVSAVADWDLSIVQHRLRYASPPPLFERALFVTISGLLALHMLIIFFAFSGVRVYACSRQSGTRWSWPLSSCSYDASIWHEGCSRLQDARLCAHVYSSLFRLSALQRLPCWPHKHDLIDRKSTQAATSEHPRHEWKAAHVRGLAPLSQAGRARRHPSGSRR